MPFTGGEIRQMQRAAATRRREQLTTHLRSMEERYARYKRAKRDHTPDARYLKQCIDDCKRTLGVR